MDNPEIWATFQPNVKFAANDVIINHLKAFFSNWSTCYDNIAYMSYLLNDHAATIREYYDKIYATTQYEYNPIWNVEGSETETRSGFDNSRNSNDFNGSTTSTGQTHVDGNGSNNHYNTAYNSAQEKVVTRDTNESASDSTGSENSNTKNSENGTNYRNYSETFTRTRGGNIGVTMTQQMIEAERNVTINMLQMYTNDFKRFFYLDCEVNISCPTTA